MNRRADIKHSFRKRFILFLQLTHFFLLFAVWLFFEPGEQAFLLYGGCYLLIGVIIMVLITVLRRKNETKKRKNMF